MSVMWVEFIEQMLMFKWWVSIWELVTLGCCFKSERNRHFWHKIDIYTQLSSIVLRELLLLPADNTWRQA